MIEVWGSGGLADEDAAGLEIGDGDRLAFIGDTGGPDDRPVGEDGIAQDRRDFRVGAVRRGRSACSPSITAMSGRGGQADGGDDFLHFGA